MATPNSGYPQIASPDSRETYRLHNPFTDTIVAHLILWITVVFSSLSFNGCGPNLAEIKQKFQKAESINTSEAYYQFLELWENNNWSTSSPECAEYYVACHNIARKRIKERFLKSGNRIELWPVLDSLHDTALSLERALAQGGWLVAPSSYTGRTDLFLGKIVYIKPMPEHIRDAIVQELIARGYSVKLGDPVIIDYKAPYPYSYIHEYWYTLEDVPKIMKSRRDNGIDIVLAISVQIDKDKTTNGLYIPRSASIWCTAFDTNDGTLILNESRSSVWRNSEYAGYSRLGMYAERIYYRITESEDSFFKRVIDSVIRPVPKYSTQK